MSTKFWASLISIAILGLSTPVTADSDSKEIQALRAEVAELRKAVAALQAIQPTITTLMPEFAERFHVMHYAGDAEDWAVAAHELLELQRLIKVIDAIDPQKGGLMTSFMTASFSKLNSAIEHGKRESFITALNETVKNCNACHDAVGSSFIKVSLDVDESLSMRHSHALVRSKKPGKHTHTH